MTTETETNRMPRVLPDGSVYAAQIDGKYFARFDEDGFLYLRGYPKHVTKAVAEETIRKVGRGRVVCTLARTRSEPDALHFWVNEDDDYGEHVLHIGSPVRHEYDGVPGWFKAAMMKHSPEGSSINAWDDEEYDDGLVAWEIFQDEMIGWNHWFDHSGWTGEGENSVLVSEPYDLDSEDMQQLTEICKMFDFRYHITGKSSHYPSCAVHIEITPNEKLSYTRPVRVISPERKAWEDRRSVVFYSMVRNQAADFIEHVLHVVNPKFVPFIKTCLELARVEKPDETVLAEYHEQAGKKWRELDHLGMDTAQPTQKILLAVQYLLAPIGGHGHASQSTGVLCADALEYFTPHTRLIEYGKMYNVERDWQLEHIKQAQENYEKNWIQYPGIETTCSK